LPDAFGLAIWVRRAVAFFGSGGDRMMTDGQGQGDRSGEAEAIRVVADLTRAGHKAEIVQISTAGLGVGLPETVPALLKPGVPGTIESLRWLLEGYRISPERWRGVASVATLKSFIDLVNRHKDKGSVVFAKTDWPYPALTAVIDYHDDRNGPRHREHRVFYPFPVTPEFKAWIEVNEKRLDQDDFAHFLEDHVAEVVTPTEAEKTRLEALFKSRFATANDLIELARELDVQTGQRVASHKRLPTGEIELSFIEEHTNRRSEPIRAPGIFMIQLRAFVDGDPIRIPVRLRYRMAGTAIVWSFLLYRWAEELRQRVTQDVVKVSTQTGLPTFEGAPES